MKTEMIKVKLFRKVLSVLLCLCLIIIPLSVGISASDITELTFLYIDKGNIIIGDGYVSGYGAYGETIDEYNPAGYCITMTDSDVSTSNTIEVEGGENYILLKDVNIAPGYFYAGLMIYNESTVDLFFTGENTFKSESGGGIEIYSDSTLILGGDGTLSTQSNSQAGIGGNGGDAGTIIINSGTITATSKSESAGIGGGSSGSGGNITINGGNIYSKGGTYAAGIGGGNGSGGGNVTINGGTVTAIGGANAAGIGGGWYGAMGTVEINGGSVYAVGADGNQYIGAGQGKAAEYPVNSQNERVYPVTFNLSAAQSDRMLVNGKEMNICGSHRGASGLYVYVPSGKSTAAVKTPDEFPSLFSINVNENGNAAVSKLNNPVGKNGAEIGSDDVLRGITCALTSVDDYIEMPDGYTLSCDNSIVGTGTVITLSYNGKPVYYYRALVYGDLNNDGMYDGEDSFIVLLMLWEMLNMDNTDPILFEAADADNDGEVTQEDMEILQRAGLLLSSITHDDIVDTDSAQFSEYISMVDCRSAQSSSAEVGHETDEQTSAFLSFVKKMIFFIENVVKILIQVDSFWNI